jgi:hypothetical protein
MPQTITLTDAQGRAVYVPPRPRARANFPGNLPSPVCHASRQPQGRLFQDLPAFDGPIALGVMTGASGQRRQS